MYYYLKLDILTFTVTQSNTCPSINLASPLYRTVFVMYLTML